MNNNDKQKKFWSEKGGLKWVEDKAVLDKRLNRFGQLALSKLKLKKEMKVLDLGCGTGETSKQIADIVGDKGEVCGLDISEPMISFAQKHYSINKNISFKVSDIQLDKIEQNLFERAFSRHGLMFFSDPIKAFKNIYDSLKNSGVLSFTCFQEPKKNLWHSIPTKIFSNYLEINDLQSSKVPSPFAFQNDKYIQEILLKSGFQNIEINGYEENTEWFLDLSPKEATEMYLRTSPAMATNIKNLSISILNKIKSDMEKEYSKFYINNNIVFPSAVWIVKAQKE